MHDLITSRLGRRLTAALATVCLAGAIAVPAGAEPEPDPPRLGVDDPAPSARDGVDRGEAVGAAPRGFSTAATTGRTGVYEDYCDDAGPGAIDLAEAFVTDVNSSLIGVEFTACGPLDATTLAGGIAMAIVTPSGAEFLLDLYEDPELGPIGELFDGDGASLSFSELSFASGERGDSVAAVFPNAAIGGPERFAFVAGSFASLSSPEPADVMPEAGEPLGVWPNPCGIGPAGLYTVTADDPAAAAASTRAAGVRAAGFERDGRATVRLLSDAGAAALAELDGIATVAPASVYRPAQVVPGADQIGAGAWWRAAANLPAAPGDGQGIDIAIIDTGVDGTRAEFGGRVGSGYDGAADRPIPAGANSSRGLHGNHVAGIAAASQTIVGAAPAATVRPYQAFYFDDCGDSLSVGRAIDAAVDDGVDIINLSLTSVGDAPPLADDPVRIATRRALAAGVTVIAAAGNSGARSLGSYPASEAGVIAVGATDRDGRVTGYSTSGPWMDLVAPGGGFGDDEPIWSLGNTLTPGGLSPQVGTSMATPVVAGAAARYLAAGGDAADVRAALRASAVPVPGTTDPERIGAGALDVVALLGSIGDDLPTPPGPTPDPTPDGPLPPPDIGPICTGTDTTRFADIPDGNPHRFAAQCLARLSISSGFPDGTYRPAGGVTRGQMATFIVNLLEQQTGQALPLGSATFPDIAGGVHRDAIRKLASAGIVAGFSDDTYRPSAQVTRDQMATFLSRAIEREVGSVPRVRSPFGDIAGSPHEAAIDRIWYLGITSGNAQGDYAPRSTVRRDQMATFVARTFAFLEESGTFTTP